ncbi:MAG: hypothetical protein Q6363_009455 [Candidatus Njordarchaeota archaeon]
MKIIYTDFINVLQEILYNIKEDIEKNFNDATECLRKLLILIIDTYTEFVDSAKDLKDLSDGKRNIIILKLTESVLMLKCLVYSLLYYDRAFKMRNVINYNYNFYLAIFYLKYMSLNCILPHSVRAILLALLNHFTDNFQRIFCIVKEAKKEQHDVDWTEMDIT